MQTEKNNESSLNVEDDKMKLASVQSQKMRLIASLMLKLWMRMVKIQEGQMTALTRKTKKLKGKLKSLRGALEKMSI